MGGVSEREGYGIRGTGRQRKVRRQEKDDRGKGQTQTQMD